MGLLRPLGVGFFGVVLGGTGGVKIGTAFAKKNGVGFGRTELSNVALYHLGMVPGVWVSKGVGRNWIFMFFEGPKIRETNSLNFSVKTGTVLLKKLG